MSYTNIREYDQSPIECLEWRPVERNTLKGFPKLRVPAWNLILDGVAVHSKNGRAWAQLPARPQLDADGKAVRDEDSGKIKYAKILEFTDRSHSDAFSDGVVDAVRRFAR
jgi:hypothetical protein